MCGRIFLILLLLVVGCSKPIDVTAIVKEPVDYRKMLVKDTDMIFYTKNTNKPYSGDVFSLYDDGKRRDEGGLKNGREDGVWTYWHENGQTRSKGNYKNGDKYGKWTYFYENDINKNERDPDAAIGNVDHDIMLAKNTMVYKTGKKWQEGFYKAGKEDGIWTIWHENGQKKMEVTLELGELISQYCWDEFGSKIECN